VGEEKGVLYLCATPIGNLEDITLRVLRVLREVDLIAAEDTRHTRKLLSHYNIHTPLTSYHRHNYRKKGEELLKLLANGREIALVSDAGMPGISDPGAELVDEALKRQLKVTPLPGASAGITALVASGLPTNAFVFEGFLPATKKARRDKLHSLVNEQRTLIFYETPHRLLPALEDILEICGNCQLAAARELTKKHEELVRGSVMEVLNHFRQKTPQGEFCLVMKGEGMGVESKGNAGGEQLPPPAVSVALLEAVGHPLKEAIRTVAKARGMSRREVYRLVVEEKEKLIN
jgi:16S rRNA (cytidine1402-2'-O)-methyltransferase